MKQIPITEQLTREIKAAVGEDVDPSRFAVFETIALNTLPLPGKNGTIFEGAEVSFLTLRQMADSINSGNHLPLIHDHDLSSTPLGRVFKADVLINDTGDAELRALFYVDETEQTLVAKLNAGSIDEVSVQFLASQILCSECSFDYRGETSSYENFSERTCTNGHTIGQDGVHVRLVGLSVFTELSLVTRGAASNPKIIGKSQSKLSAPLQALAAKGFEVDELFLAASKGVNEVNLESLVTQLTEQTSRAAIFEAELSSARTERDALNEKVSALETQIEELTTALAAAQADDASAVAADLEASKVFLTDLYKKLAVAAGQNGDDIPEDVIKLREGIEKYQSDLTALLPVGGVSTTKKDDQPSGSKFNASTASAFRV